MTGNAAAGGNYNYGKANLETGNMIYPLPAVMVSYQREGEKPNIITVAWTGTVCTNPPMVLYFGKTAALFV